MHRLIDCQQDLLESLKSRQTAFHYLNAALHDDDPRIFILALNNVMQAQLDTELLQTVHPIEENPSLTNIKTALKLLNLEFVIKQRSSA